MGFSLQWLLLRSTGSGHTGFSSCSTWAEVLCSTWGLPESKLETVFCSGRRILIHCGGGVGGGLVDKSFPTLATPWTVACQAPLSVGFSRQEYWSGLPFPPPAYSPYNQGSPGL